MKVYLIEKREGFGLYESPYQYSSTGLIYIDKDSANTRAAKLWVENVPEESERNSTWCPIHYKVREVEVL
jgi:hypothetical protein